MRDEKLFVLLVGLLFCFFFLDSKFHEKRGICGGRGERGEGRGEEFS
jgi:hypothetical protein